jgi:hypothetical protein
MLLYSQNCVQLFCVFGNYIPFCDIKPLIKSEGEKESSAEPQTVFLTFLFSVFVLRVVTVPVFAFQSAGLNAVAFPVFEFQFGGFHAAHAVCINAVQSRIPTNKDTILLLFSLIFSTPV